MWIWQVTTIAFRSHRNVTSTMYPKGRQKTVPPRRCERGRPMRHFPLRGRSIPQKADSSLRHRRCPGVIEKPNHQRRSSQNSLDKSGRKEKCRMGRPLSHLRGGTVFCLPWDTSCWLTFLWLRNAIVVSLPKSTSTFAASLFGEGRRKYHVDIPSFRAVGCWSHVCVGCSNESCERWRFGQGNCARLRLYLPFRR